MTCIVGMAAADGSVWIGADSAAVSGLFIEVTSLPKVFQAGAFLIGYTNSFRMGQLLQYQLTVRPQHEDEADDFYIVSVAVEAIRTCLKDHGYATVSNNAESGGFFLVGYKTGLWEVGSDYGVVRSASGFSAIGCGQGYAIGAMAALAGVEPEARIRKSLEVAARFSSGVCGPFLVRRWQEHQGAERLEVGG